MLISGVQYFAPNWGTKWQPGAPPEGVRSTRDFGIPPGAAKEEAGWRRERNSAGDSIDDRERAMKILQEPILALTLVDRRRSLGDGNWGGTSLWLLGNSDMRRSHQRLVRITRPHDIGRTACQSVYQESTNQDISEPRFLGKSP